MPHRKKDHRIRIRISDFKNLYYNDILLSNADADVYCTLIIQETFPKSLNSDDSTAPDTKENAFDECIILTRRGNIVSNIGSKLIGNINPNPNTTKASTSTLSSHNQKRRSSFIGIGAMSQVPRGDRASISLNQNSIIYSKPKKGSSQTGKLSYNISKHLLPAENFISARIDISLNDGLSNDEFEFELNENFHLVSIFLIKRGKITDSILAKLDLPFTFFEPDELPHEEWLHLYNLNTSLEGGHSFKESSRQSVQICIKCSFIVWDTSDVLECKNCGIFCHSKCAEKRLPCCALTPFVRISYVYVREHILQHQEYLFLDKIFMSSDLTLWNVFARSLEYKDESAYHIIQICLSLPKRHLVNLIAGLCEREIEDTNTFQSIFRGNSLAIKLLDFYMKHAGTGYIIFSIESPLKDIIKENNDCEIDPTRISNSDDSKLIENRIEILQEYTYRLMKSITSSPRNCPFALRVIFQRIFNKAKQKFADEPLAGYIAVSSFLFLRFFGAAIITPCIYGLSIDVSSSKSRRTLTMLSKIIQKCANFSEFDDSKESFAVKLNRFVPKYHPIIIEYIDAICRVSVSENVKATSMLKTYTSSLFSSTKTTLRASNFSFLLFFQCCVPSRKQVYESTASFDVFRDPTSRGQLPQDSEDMENIPNDPSLALIDIDLHYSALCRQIFKIGEKMVLNCQSNDETFLVYKILEKIKFVHIPMDGIAYKDYRTKLLFQQKNNISYEFEAESNTLPQSIMTENKSNRNYHFETENSSDHSSSSQSASLGYRFKAKDSQNGSENSSSSKSAYQLRANDPLDSQNESDNSSSSRSITMSLRLKANDQFDTQNSTDKSSESQVASIGSRFKTNFSNDNVSLVDSIESENSQDIQNGQDSIDVIFKEIRFVENSDKPYSSSLMEPQSTDDINQISESNPEMDKSLSKTRIKPNIVEELSRSDSDLLLNPPAVVEILASSPNLLINKMSPASSVSSVKITHTYGNFEGGGSSVLNICLEHEPDDSKNSQILDDDFGISIDKSKKSKELEISTISASVNDTLKSSRKNIHQIGDVLSDSKDFEADDSFGESFVIQKKETVKKTNTVRKKRFSFDER